MRWFWAAVPPWGAMREHWSSVVGPLPPSSSPRQRAAACLGQPVLYVQGLVWDQDICQDHSYLGCHHNVTSTSPNIPNPLCLCPLQLYTTSTSLQVHPHLLAGDSGGCSGDVFSLISHDSLCSRWSGRAKLPCLQKAVHTLFMPPEQGFHLSDDK